MVDSDIVKENILDIILNKLVLLEEVIYRGITALL